MSAVVWVEECPRNRETAFRLLPSCSNRVAKQWRLCRARHNRHRFATHTLVHWYRSNQDPERKLPLLSAYLGHVHVADTQWYLSGSPELMREAMRRLEQRWEDRP